MAQEINFGKLRIPIIKGDKGDKGDQGIQGIQGEKGDTGASNILTIGRVVQGEQASASITGDSPNQVLNLILPKGDKGEKGDTGEQGQQGIQGIQGEKGDKGDKGDTGEQGETGATGDTGNGIASVEKTSTSGLVDTYTITFTDGTTTTFEVTNGEDGEVSEEEFTALENKVKSQQKILDQMPKVTGEGTEFTMENTIEAEFVEFLPGGNTGQETTTGKNKLTGDATNTSRGMTTTISENIITVTGTTAGNWWTGVGGNISIPAGNVALSIQKALPFSITFILTLQDETTKNLTIAKGNLSATSSISSNAVSYQINFASATENTTYNETIEMQLELNSVVTSYEKYTGGIASPNVDYPSDRYSAGANGSITEKIVNKNFHNKTTDVSGKRLSSDGTLINDSGYATTDFIPVIPSSNIVYSRAENGGGSAAIVFYTKNKVGISRTMPIMATTATSKTIAIPENAYYIKTCDSASIMDNVQIKIGSTATPYEEHQEQTYTIPVQQEMRSIGTVRDEFVKTENGWFERHKINRKALKDFQYNFTTTATGNLFTAIGTQVEDFKKIVQTVKSNIFLGIESSTGRQNNNIYYNQSNDRLDIICNEYDNATDFKAMLEEKNGYVDYYTTEPTDLPCTQAQITALENLPNTYAEQTNVLSEDTVPAYVKASGYLDLNTLVARVAQLETEV